MIQTVKDAIERDIENKFWRQQARKEIMCAKRKPKTRDAEKKRYYQHQNKTKEGYEVY